MDIGRSDSIAEEIPRSQFLCLPPEIHEHIFRYCGVCDIRSLALVNRFLKNIVRSKLRDLLVAACQNDYFDDIDQLYEFPDDPRCLWKVVNTIQCLDNFRNAVVQTIRWDVFKDCSYDKTRTIYLLDHYQRLCLPWADVPTYQRHSPETSPDFHKQLLECLSDTDIQAMISSEKIMIEQLSHYLAWPHFHALGWSEALIGRGLAYFLRIVRCESVPRRRRTLPAWARWPWDRTTPPLHGELDVSDDIFRVLCDVVQRPPTIQVLVGETYKEEKNPAGERVDRTKLNEMWKVII